MTYIIIRLKKIETIHIKYFFAVFSLYTFKII